MAKKKPPEEHENLERWLVSYGDFITLLFATFVVLYALSQIDISEFNALEDSIKKAFSAPSLLEGSEAILDGKDSIFDASSADSVIAPLMLEYVSQKYEEQSFKDIKSAVEQLKQNGDLSDVEASITDSGLLISFKNDFLFYSGSATLTDKALKALDDIGVLIGEKFALHYIRVEGHTDNLPINNFVYPSNWELSSARSSAVVRYLIQRFNFMPNIFTSVGYADTRPLVENTNDVNRAKNRRVEILVLKNKFKNLEHSSASILTQSKAAQEAFQAQRTANIQKIKTASPELRKIKTTPTKDEKKVEEKTSNIETDEVSDDEEQKLSVRNKTLYEQAGSSDNLDNKKSNENSISGVKDKKVLQPEINKQFDMIGQ